MVRYQSALRSQRIMILKLQQIAKISSFVSGRILIRQPIVPDDNLQVMESADHMYRQKKGRVNTHPFQSN